MRNIVSLRLKLLLPILAVLFLSGCIERSEEITIAKNGETTIVATFEGERSEFEPPLALPSEPEWTISTDSSQADNKNIKIEAEIVVPYGQPFPETFAKTKTGEENINLIFPTEVKYWREGNRTFYEFQRTYKARKYNRYNYMIEEEMDKDLEKRVMEEGIFEVTQQDRDNYISKLIEGYSFFHFMIFSDVLGNLALDNIISTADKNRIEEKAIPLVESIITPKRVLDILGLDDYDMDAAYDNLVQQLQIEFKQLYYKEIGDNDKTKIQRYDASFEKVWTDYQITQKIDMSEFVIVIKMPGVVVSTNGLSDPEEPFSVGWHFDGSELHDHDIPLYALSVVENK